MCAKLTVWALTWDAVLDRAERALQDTGVYGIKTTIPYYQEILKSANFQAGKFDTSFVETHPELTNYTEQRHTRNVAAAIGAALAAHMGL
jgi:pyruvate carboxylase subunit A